MILLGILIGHNRDIAWGITMVTGDEQDLFIMTEDDSQTRYQYKGEWESYQVRTEMIPIKGGSYHNITVRSSRYGPVINDVFGVQGI